MVHLSHRPLLPVFVWAAYPGWMSLTAAPWKQYVVIPRGTHVLHLEKGRQQLYNETLQFLNQPSMSTNQHAIAVIFEDYHLRIADVVRNYGMFDRQEAPADSKDYHHTP